MKLNIETSETELDRLIQFLKEVCVLKLTRLEAIEATQLLHAARIAALEEAVAALQPGPDLSPRLAALEADLAAVKTELGAVEVEG